MKYLAAIVMLITSSVCFSQTCLDSLFTELRQPEFGRVYKARDEIINYQQEAIPKLIVLLKDTSYVKLENTADLIYPGAKEFYGHGWIVNYDIDWIAARAAWVLEEITFRDFGYQDLAISEDKLMSLHTQNYTTYLQTGSHKVDFSQKTSREQLITYRLMLADSVSKWWNRNKNSWTRFNALKEALSSTDIEMQRLALQYLRFGKTLCEGLNADTYTSELKPLVIKIRDSKGDMTVQADYLLKDESFYWLRIKTGKKK